MTAPATKEPETGTALVVTPEDKSLISPERRAMIAEQKQRNIVVAKLAETNWGKGMDVETRRAVADWAWRNEVDATTEVHVLGGNIYLNGQFYINRLVRLQEAGLVLMATSRFIHNDARLDPKVPAEAEEIAERRRHRIHFAIPDEAPSAAMFQLRLASNPDLVYEAAKTAGSFTNPRTKKDRNDPIGDAFPAETAVTRAARRCCKFAIAQLPELGRILRVTQAEEDAATSLTAVVRAAYDRNKELSESIRETERRNRAPLELANLDYEGKPLAESKAKVRPQLEIVDPYEEEPAAIARAQDADAELSQEEPDHENDPMPAAEKPKAQPAAATSTTPAPKAAAAVLECPGCGRKCEKASDHHPECRRYADD